MANEITTQITIQAPASVVWNILMNFQSYPAWNPFIKEISGEAIVGTSLKVRIQPMNSKGMTFKPKVLICNPNVHFQWKGQLFIPGIFDGKHEFKIQENKDGSSTLFHNEQFSGILSGIYNTTNAQLGFEAMNDALKSRAELQVSDSKNNL